LSLVLVQLVKHERSPIDTFRITVSSTALAEAESTLKYLVPDVYIILQIENYVTDELNLLSFDGCTLVIYIGGSIGNFSREETERILDHVHEQLKPDDALSEREQEDYI